MQYEKDTFVPDSIDLRPLLAHPAAVEMLLLARGQLNRAFQKHGLIAPDPLATCASVHVDSAELDDPAANGIEHAKERYGDAFIIWAEGMPLKLACPVLDILRQTRRALSQQQDDRSGASAAVLKAYEFLLDCSQPGQDRPDSA